MHQSALIAFPTSSYPSFVYQLYFSWHDRLTLLFLLRSMPDSNGAIRRLTTGSTRNAPIIPTTPFNTLGIGTRGRGNSLPGGSQSLSSFAAGLAARRASIGGLSPTDALFARHGGALPSFGASPSDSKLKEEAKKDQAHDGKVCHNISIDFGGF